MYHNLLLKITAIDTADETYMLIKILITQTVYIGHCFQ